MVRRMVVQMLRQAPLVAAVRVADGGMTSWQIQGGRKRTQHTPMRPIAIWVMPVAQHLTNMKKVILERAAVRVVRQAQGQRIRVMELIYPVLGSHTFVPSQGLMSPTRVEELVPPGDSLRRRLAAERIPTVAVATPAGRRFWRGYHPVSDAKARTVRSR